MKPFPRRSWFVTLRNLLQRLPFQPLDINCLYFLQYEGIPAQDRAFARALCEIRGATLADLPGMTECQPTPDTFRKRFEMNDHCAVAVIGGRIVGYEWFCSKSSHLEERYAYMIDIPPDAIYAYDAFIVPEHRLSGVWLKFKTVYLRELMRTLRKRKIITMIDRGNRISMSTHLRFGFQMVRMVFVFKLFGKSFFINGNIGNEKLTTPRPMSFAGVQEASESKASWPSNPPPTELIRGVDEQR